MLKTLVLAGSALASIGAQAQAVSYTSVQYTTSAFASAETVVNGTSAANPTAALPISSVATATGLNDFANAAAVAGAGLLTATASTDSLAGAASSEGYARFIGSFSNPGLFTLNLNLNATRALSGGTGDSQLFVLLTNTVGTATSTLFNDVFTRSGLYTLSYNLAAGSTSQLSLFLTSDANSAAGQTAQTFGQLAFSAAVPEPASWLLLALGGGVLLLARRRRSVA